MIRGLLVLPIVLFSLDSLGQAVFASTDSTRLTFSNKVTIDLKKVVQKGRVGFTLTPHALKTLMVQYNYVYKNLELTQERVQLIENELTIKDQVVVTTQEQLKTTNDRLLLYSSGYDQLKSISADYDKQTKQLLADMEAISKVNRKSNRKKFMQGLGLGLVITVACIVVRD